MLFDEQSAENLQSKFPLLDVEVTRSQTLLRRSVDTPEDLDAFLDQLFCWGVGLEEVHRLTRAPGEDVVYEIRVSGELRPSLLRKLGVAHGVVLRQVRVVLIAVTSSLHQFLRSCSENGAKINRVRRSDEAKLSASAYRVDAPVDA